MPVIEKTYELHGAGRVPFPDALAFGGGVFGGPQIPIERAGIFVDHWPLPAGMWHDNTIGGPLNLGTNLPDRCIRESGQPVVGLADYMQRRGPFGIQPGYAQYLGDWTTAPASSPFLSGFLFGVLLARPGRRLATGVFAGLCSSAAKLVVQGVTNEGASPSTTSLGVVAGSMLAVWMARKEQGRR